MPSDFILTFKKAPMVYANINALDKPTNPCNLYTIFVSMHPEQSAGTK